MMVIPECIPSDIVNEVFHIAASNKDLRAVTSPRTLFLHDMSCDCDVDMCYNHKWFNVIGPHNEGKVLHACYNSTTSCFINCFETTDEEAFRRQVYGVLYGMYGEC